MKDLVEFVRRVNGFDSKAAPLQVKVFGWYLHSHKTQEHFTSSDIGACFDAAHVSRPANISSTLAKLVVQKAVLRSNEGFRLSSAARSDMEKLLPVRAASVATARLLEGLLAKLANPAQRTFLNETLQCFKHNAYRAAIVMAWNLAYSHVCERVFASHLQAFNAQRAKAYPRLPDVTKLTDFEDYKESQVIEICRGARILDATVCRHLTAQLNRRNSAAHPSSATFTESNADDTITDLVNNVLLNPNV